jgi:beta-glucanase (GH16 family)
VPFILIIFDQLAARATKMSKVNVLIAFVSMVVGACPANAEGPVGTAPHNPSPKYRLLWSDEFNNAGAPDPAKWDYERGFVRNEEFQWYQPENVRCNDGKLIIEARRERFENPRYDEGSRDWRVSRRFVEYTSASINTRGKHEWQYGRFEMRGRIDVRPGMWPAFWTLGTSRGWPACGEIDIMEYYQGTLLANAAWLGRGRRAQWDELRRPITQFPESWSKAFHIWRMDWDHDYIRLYVDNELLNEVDLANTINDDRQRNNPFREPHYILLNLAIGGRSGGDPTTTVFPGRLEVDYVRVYQKPDNQQQQVNDSK